MSNPDPNPIAQRLLAQLKRGASGQLEFSEDAARTLANDLLAHGDEELASAVLAISRVAMILGERFAEKHNAEAIRDRILDIAELAIGRLERAGRQRDRELEVLKRVLISRTGGVVPIHRAPAFDAKRPAGTVAASSLGSRRRLR